MERRMAERKKFTRLLDMKLCDRKSGNLICKANGIDISDNGLGIMSECSPIPGTVLQVNIPLNEAGIRLPIFAEVAWASPFRESFRAGLTFLGI